MLFLEQVDNHLEVFSNPTTSVIQIHFEYLNEPFVIYNGIGQAILQGNLSESIDLQDFMKGIYWLKVGNQWAKFVKE